jgi:hypothetical protein
LRAEGRGTQWDCDDAAYGENDLALPDLPDAEFTLRVRGDAERQSADLASLLAEGLSIDIG